MDSTKITVTMIDTAVSRGLKDMEDDPKRTIRKLADLGKQFSTGRFQPRIFEIIQNLLENEESPYYDLLQYFLGHTDHENAKKFGINLGYYSWTYYARKLRETAKKKGYAIPWSINLAFDTDIEGTCNDSLTVSQLKEIIHQAKLLGINTFSITLIGNNIPDNELFTIFDEFPECAFFFLLGDCQITVAQQNKLKKSGNVLLLVNCSSEDALATCDALNISGNLYSIYYRYDDLDIVSLEQRNFYDRLSEFPASMLFLIPKNISTKSAGPIVKEIRMEQKCPYFNWDFRYDSMQIGKILCDEDILLSFDKTGKPYLPSCAEMRILTNGITLEDILSKTMPQIQTT